MPLRDWARRSPRARWYPTDMRSIATAGSRNRRPERNTTRSAARTAGAPARRPPRRPRPAAPCREPPQLAELASLMRAAEKIVGGPVEIEWALDEQGIKLLQARSLPVAQARVPDAIWRRP